MLACCRGAALGKARARGHVATGTRGRMKELVFQGFSAPWQGRGPWRGRHACGDARHRKGRVWARRVKLLPTSGERKGGPSQTRIRARGLGLLGAMGRTGRKGEGRRVCIVLWGLAGLRHQHGRQRKLNDGERSRVLLVWVMQRRRRSPQLAFYDNGAPYHRETSKSSYGSTPFRT